MESSTITTTSTAETKARKLAAVRAALARFKSGKIKMTEKAASFIEEIRREDSDLGGLVAGVEECAPDTDDAAEGLDVGEDDREITFQKGDDGENLSFVSAPMRNAFRAEKERKIHAGIRIKSQADWSKLFA